MDITQPTSSYNGQHAELYDLFYADKSYEDEAKFLNHCIQDYQPGTKKILELACGTGSHSLILEKYGYQIIATDYSIDMLTQARRKAESCNSAIYFRQMDMRSLNVPERPFDVVICLFDSIGYLITNENILRAFVDVRSHLRPGGLFIFEFWHAPAMLRGYDPLRIRRFKVKEGEILRISETQIDHQHSLCYVNYSIYDLKDNGYYQFLQETQINRFFLIQEMSNFLLQAGLFPLKWYAGFQNNEKIDANTWHIVTIAAKPEEKLK